MSHHKYNPRQMLFVKNVPQESALRIAALFLPYKPLETKNLYPDSRITTFMIALPNVGATEEALRHTDGLRVANTVISVERYNAKQSIVARRDARKKQDGPMVYDQGGEYGGVYDYEDYDVDGEVQEEIGLSVAEQVAAQAVDMPVAEARKVCKDGSVSWANVASGGVTGEHSPALGPAVVEGPQELIPPRESSVQSGKETLDTRPARKGTSVSANFGPPTEDTSSSPVANPVKPPPGFEQYSLKHEYIPAPSWQGPRLSEPLSSTNTSSSTQFYTARESQTPPPATETESSESRRFSVDTSQQTPRHDEERQRRGGLGMSADSSHFLRARHCRNCTVCQMMFRWQQ